MDVIIELRPEFCLLIFIAFGCLLKVCNPVAVFIHELGHALPALWLTKDKVTLRIGREYGGWQIPITRRCTLTLHMRQAHLGYCEYAKRSLPVIFRITVALGGPFASACAVLASVIVLVEPTWVPLTGKFLLVVFFYANLKLLITSTLPLVYRDHRSGKALVSDGFDIITMIRG